MNIMGKRTCLWGSDCGGDGGKGRESVKGREEKGLYSEYVSILVPRSIGVSGFWERSGRSWISWISRNSMKSSGSLVFFWMTPELNLSDGVFKNL